MTNDFINNSLSKSNGKQDHSSGNESDEATLQNVEQQPIDTSQMKFFPRMWYLTKLSATRSYSVCVTAGERLAWFFGITKPKYHAEIQHYESMNDEEREAWRQAFQDVEHTDHIRKSIR